ncbi:MAG: TrbC/VirB2 family protein [Candidatus Buchananbacteria bacterium]
MKKIFKTIFCLLLLTLLPLAAFAVQLEDPLKLDQAQPISALATKIINALLGLAGVAALLAFIYGGILWMTAGISADNIKKGKTVMIWAVAGLLVIFSSYAAVTFIFSMLAQ